MTISSASLFRAFTTSNINDVSSHQAIPDSEHADFCGLTSGIRSWYQTQHREHKKNEFSELTRSILDEFAKNENRASITISVNNKNLVVSEYPDSVELVFEGKTNRLENMTLKDFVTRIRVDRAVNGELYGIPSGERQRLGDTSLALTNANLQNMNLSGANLRRTNLAGANLMGADLTGANLSAANLKGALLSGANLPKINLSGADLSGAKLIKTQLSGANLSGAKLTGADLSKSNLSATNLTGAHLSGTNLAGVNLKGALLDRADLTNANLTGALLSGIDLLGANLSGANLTEAILIKANLCGVNLIGANLTRANLFNARLNGADLTEANLSGTSLYRVTLTKANLSGTDMSGTDLTGASLSGAKLQNATVRLQLPLRWGQAELDQHFNHIANGNSLLTAIDSIDDTFSLLKIDLIHQILQAINQPQIDLYPFYKNFFLLLSSRYYNDGTIKAFLTDKVILPTIEQANSQAWTNVKQKICEVLLRFVESTKDFDYIKNNGFFVQLILNSLSHNDTTLTNSAEHLYEHYLSLERIKPFTALDDFGVYAENKVDWSDQTANNYILVRNNFTILISQENLQNMLATNKISAAWNHFFLYQQDADQCLIEERLSDIGALFKAFKIFDQQYQFYKNIAKFVAILEVLKLGNYHADFIAALDKKPIKKMIDPDIQLELGILFANVMSSDTKNPADMRLRPEHWQEIVNKFGLADADKTTRAQTLFCLTVVFARYSSSYIFGTEYDSPQAIRQYAYTLMNEARFQHPRMISVPLFNDWKNKLLGLNNAFTCTAVLSAAMTDYARNLFPHILNGILPPAWR